MFYRALLPLSLVVVFSATCLASEIKKLVFLNRSSLSTSVMVGDTIYVSMPITLGTGFHWEFSKSPKFLKKISSVSGADVVNVPGSSGSTTFMFLATAIGTEQIAFELFSPLGDQKPERTNRLSITVR